MLLLLRSCRDRSDLATIRDSATARRARRLRPKQGARGPVLSAPKPLSVTLKSTSEEPPPGFHTVRNLPRPWGLAIRACFLSSREIAKRPSCHLPVGLVSMDIALIIHELLIEG